MASAFSRHYAKEDETPFTPLMSDIHGFLLAMSGECAECLHKSRCRMCYSNRAKILLARLKEEMHTPTDETRQAALDDAVVRFVASRKNPPVRGSDINVAGMPHRHAKGAYLMRLVASGRLCARRVIRGNHRDVVFWTPEQTQFVNEKQNKNNKNTK